MHLEQGISLPADSFASFFTRTSELLQKACYRSVTLCVTVWQMVAVRCLFRLQQMTSKT